MEEVFKTINFPPGYEPEQLNRDDVALLTSKIVAWYPDIVVGSESRHTRQEFYIDECFLKGGDPQRSILPVVAKFKGEIVAFASFERNSDSRTLTCPLGVVAPEHRKSGISVLGWGLIEVLGRSMGAEMIYAYATLKSPHQQVLAEKYGFQLVGIIPGNDRDMVSPGEVRRVYEGLYVKVLCEDELLIQPNPEALTPKTKALWEFLFRS